jgi:lysophospholipase L1-like esterase
MRPARLSSTVILSAAIAVCLAAAQPVTRAQSGRAGDHWVGTWATAVVSRLPVPQSPAQALGAGLPAPQCFGQAPPESAATGSATTTAPASTTATPPGAAPGTAGRGQVGGGRGGPLPAPINFSNQTLREIVHVSIGGDRVRVALSNAFGTSALAIGASHIALREKDAAIVAKSDRTLTFGGSPSVNIPPGAVVVSDPVSLTVPALADVAIDVYLPGDTAASTSPLTTHASALQTSYVFAGNQTGKIDLPEPTTTSAWFFLARVEVAAPQQVGAVVTIGDSITDGSRSTPNTNNRWPDHLARRLQAQRMTIGVLNEGIAGNRTLSDGAGVSLLARFDRDVLAQAGVTHAVVFESINDIGLGRANPCPSAADLIAAQQQLIERAHARGIKIFGATLTPFEGAAYWTAEGEAKRQALNTWIRTGKAYDGVIDFDAAVRDPSAPTKLQSQFNPGDNLHLNDAGYQAMANAIDLALFKAR